MKFKLAAVFLGIALSSSAGAATVVQDARQLIASGDAGIALVQLDTWLAGNPKDAEARFMRAMALSRLDRKPEAIRAFTDLIKDQPRYPEPYNNLGVLLAGMGDYAKARTAFETALSKNPQYSSAQQNLADVNLALAGEAYQKLLAMDPGNTVAQAKLELLRSLQGSAPASPVAAATPAAATEPAAAEASASPAATPPVAAPSQADLQAAGKDVAASVRDWADAWIKQDVKRHLGHYAGDFTPPGGMPLTKWIEQRRSSMVKPKKINLKIEEVKLAMLNEQQARISFRQSYQSDLSKEVVIKTLDMRKIAGSWMIAAERNTNP
ncbi:tetratricopeptide repeat protein [Solimonas sp. K1W22B-7]|uniref:nuclear transport factor 2 family protein n=1 Tax=Solimonas sp. K1W22B-7 TaxID=2303331 RepID=UPI000E32E9A3|nr:nuclear transport factor 2 family protein [Solimonas sp. K1W22B-7]AXQ30347.1 tetratricopeptide repeat protein [Solimonas sp. K1W22B-7]